MRKKLIFTVSLIIIIFLVFILIFFLQRRTAEGWIDIPTGTDAVTRPYSDDLIYRLYEDREEYYVAGFDPSRGDDINTNVNIPSVYNGLPVTGISEEAFMDEEVTSVRIPASIKTIEAYAFYKCIFLKEVFLNDGLIEIGRSAFSKCKSLEEISFPRSLKIIGETVFLDCTALKKVIFGNGTLIESIGYGAFTSCTSLKSVDIPKEAPLSDMQGYVFENCTALLGFTVPDSTKEILNYTFANCTSLSEIYIGKRVESISEGAFMYCGSIKSITVSDESPFFSSTGGCLLSRDMTELHRATEDAVIPSSVVTIKPYAFSNCDSITNIVLGESVSMLGIGAFEGCVSLKSIDIPKKVTILPKDVFKGCSALSSLTIRSDKLFCASSALDNCISLKDIYFSGSELEWLQFKYTYELNTQESWDTRFSGIAVHYDHK